MAVKFTKQKRATLTQVVVGDIRQAILENRFKPGERIVESRIAEEMSISRYPVREALRYLEKEGLVENVPFKGVFVASITPADTREILAVRSALEELAVRSVIEQENPEHLERLEAIMGRMREGAAEGDHEKVWDNDMLFHQSLCELSGNGHLLEIWSTLAKKISSMVAQALRASGKVDHFVATHQEILDAIRREDAMAAEAVIRKHVQTTVDLLRLAAPEKSEEDADD